MSHFSESEQALENLGKTSRALLVDDSACSQLQSSLERVKKQQPKLRDNAAKAISELGRKLEMLPTSRRRARTGDNASVPKVRRATLDRPVRPEDKILRLVQRGSRAALRSIGRGLQRMGAWLSR